MGKKKIITYPIEIPKGIENPSKLLKTRIYYLKKELVNNLKGIDLSKRLVIVDVYAQFVQEGGNRGEYMFFLQPKTGLPDIRIKNPASFLLFCNIHGFFPIIDKIYFKNGQIVLDSSEYKEFILLVKLFHLFFNVGFDFVLHDAIRKLLRKENIIKIFDDKNISLPLTAEIQALVNLMGDTKKSSFDIPKHYLNQGLQKLKNKGTYRENVFLEIAMKYENWIRKYMGVETTYIKSASYKEDTSEKTDFNFLFSDNEKSSKYKNIPIQFTTSSEENKFKILEDYFYKSHHPNFIYLQSDGDFARKVIRIEQEYKSWLENPEKREMQDPSNFPFFIHELRTSKIKDLIILYFYLHQIVKNPNKVEKINLKIENIDLKAVDINFSKLKSSKKFGKSKKINVEKYTYKFIYKGEYIGTIVFLNKVGS